MRRIAAWALGEIGPSAAAAIPALFEALKHENAPTVRGAMADAVSKIKED